MSNLLDAISGPMGQQVVQMIGQNLGTDQSQTQKAVGMALPVLLSAMSQNAQTEQGASGLFNAITKDHDGSILDNLGGFMSNYQQGSGAGILGHVLGNKLGGVESAISQQSGLSGQQTGAMLQMLAPVLLGMLGKQQRSQGLDMGSLVSMITGAATATQANSGGQMGWIGSLLDQNNDGSVIDDVAKMGMNILGNMFKK